MTKHVDLETLSEDDRETLNQLAAKMNPGKFVLRFKNRPHFAGLIGKSIADFVNQSAGTTK